MAGGAKGSQETIGEINIVPLVDIILVVLIIFMVTAPALNKPSVSVTLPEASSGDETTPSELNIVVAADGTVFFNSEKVDEAGVKERARAKAEQNPETQAVIMADRDLPYGEIVRVMDWVKSSGVKHFAVTTEQTLTQ